MTEEDWQLSGAIMAVSEGTRSEVEAAVRQVVEGGGVVDTALDGSLTFRGPWWPWRFWRALRSDAGSDLAGWKES